MDNKLLSAVKELCARNNSMTLATISEKNAPQAATVFYVNEEYDFFFFSSYRSRHAINISRNSQAAVTISDNSDSWTEIKGIQMEGEVFKIENSGGKAKVVNMFLNKFSFMEKVLADKGKVYTSIRETGIYKFRAKKIWLTDNEYGFGERREIKI